MFLASGFLSLVPVVLGGALEWGWVQLGGAEGDRTPDFRLAKPALSQLSYSPVAFVPYPAPGRLVAIVALLRGT